MNGVYCFGPGLRKHWRGRAALDNVPNRLRRVFHRRAKVLSVLSRSRASLGIASDRLRQVSCMSAVALCKW